MKIPEEKRKAFGDCMREALGSVSPQDEDFFNRDLIQGVGGETVAEKYITRFTIMIFVEIVAAMVLGSAQVIEGEVIWYGLLILAIKDVSIMLVLVKIRDEDYRARAEWTKDKRRIATAKICLAKMGELKSDVDLDDYDFREPSVLDEYDPKNWFYPY